MGFVQVENIIFELARKKITWRRIRAIECLCLGTIGLDNYSSAAQKRVITDSCPLEI